MSSAIHRTRIKICGLTREQDVDAAVQAGADAIGFILYPASPRHVSVERAAQLARRLPPFVTPVLLFVNEPAQSVLAARAAVAGAVVQFHGDETPEQCNAVGPSYIRAARIPLDGAAACFDLVKYAQQYSLAQAILLDAHVDGYGGSGKTFNWSLISNQLAPGPARTLAAPCQIVLSGGLTAANVIDGILQLRPWAVDVSSGVEASKGLKDPEKIHQFVAAVRLADEQIAEKLHVRLPAT
jgi:phosphoribosylanthranilate isomerase